MDKIRYQYAVAMRVAENICESLRPLCENIIIAGSLRRRKPDVGDIEILYVARIENRPDGLFDTRNFNPVDELLEIALREGNLCKRPNVRGHFTWGEKNKLAVHLPSSIPVDFFATTKENWWCSLVIRTGGKETNLKLTTGAQRLGRTLNAYGAGITCSDGTVIPATSERHVFELCNVPYLDPENR